jgi:hypothetical protein
MNAIQLRLLRQRCERIGEQIGERAGRQAALQAQVYVVARDAARRGAEAAVDELRRRGVLPPRR